MTGKGVGGSWRWQSILSFQMWLLYPRYTLCSVHWARYLCISLNPFMFYKGIKIIYFRETQLADVRTRYSVSLTAIISDLAQVHMSCRFPREILMHSHCWEVLVEWLFLVLDQRPQNYVIIRQKTHFLLGKLARNANSQTPLHLLSQKLERWNPVICIIESPSWDSEASSCLQTTEVHQSLLQFVSAKRRLEDVIGVVMHLD